MSTMKEIAKLAGVSTGTVDRALNNKPGVSAKTRARILDIAKSLDYHPNKLGRGLVMRNKNIHLAFIVEPVSNPFFADLMDGAEKMSQRLKESGITTHIFCMETHEERELIALLDKAAELEVVGIALNAINSDSVRKRLEQLREKGVKIVTCSADIAPSARDCFVGFKHEQSGRVAAELLAKFAGGRGDFAAVIGYRYLMSHMQRLKGFVDKLSESYPEIRLVKALETREQDEEAFYVTSRLLEEHPEVNGIYVAGYGMRGIAKAITEAGREKNIKVLCYDTPPVVQDCVRKGIVDAVICQDPIRQGAMALKMLSDLATDTEPVPETYMTDIDIRLAENMEKDKPFSKYTFMEEL